MGSDPNQEEYIMSEQEKNTTPAQMKMFLTRIPGSTQTAEN